MNKLIISFLITPFVLFGFYDPAGVKKDKENVSLSNPASHGRSVIIKSVPKESEYENHVFAIPGNYRIYYDEGTGDVATIHLDGAIKVKEETLQEFIKFGDTIKAFFGKELRIENVQLELDESGIQKIGIFTFVHYKILHEVPVITEESEVPVIDAEIILRFREGHLLQIYNNSFFDYDPPEEVSVKTKAEIIKIVKKDAKLKDDGKILNSPKLVYKRMPKRHSPAQSTLKLVWVVELIRSNPEGKWTYTLDAESGKILEIYNDNFYSLAGHVSGSVTGRTYKSKKKYEYFPNIKVEAKTPDWRNVVFANYSGFFQFLDVNKAHLVAYVRGSNFSVITRMGALGKSEKNASGYATNDLLFDDTNSSFAERQAYYHLNIARNWALEVLDINDWLKNDLVVANVNINGACNAYFNKFTGTLNFLKGGPKELGNGQEIECANSAEIADIMYHEWGHALHQNTGGIRERAFSEGIADTISTMITGSPIIGLHFIKNVPDKVSHIRTLTVPKVYPDDIDDDVHVSGLIIGTTLYELRAKFVMLYGEEVGYGLFKTLFLAHLYTASGMLDSYNAMLVLDDNNNDLTDGTPHYCLINHVYANHGLASRDKNCNY